MEDDDDDDGQIVVSLITSLETIVGRTSTKQMQLQREKDMLLSRFASLASETFENAKKRGYMCGTLTKQGNVFKTWRDRFFVLNDTRMLLFYYENEEKGIVKGAIELQGCEALRDVTRGKDLCFQICYPKEPSKRKYFLLAKNRQDLQHWIKKINQVIQQHAVAHFDKFKQGSCFLTSFQPHNSQALPVRRPSGATPLSLRPESDQKRCTSLPVLPLYRYASGTNIQDDEVPARALSDFVHEKKVFDGDESGEGEREVDECSLSVERKEIREGEEFKWKEANKDSKRQLKPLIVINGHRGIEQAEVAAKEDIPLPPSLESDGESEPNENAGGDISQEQAVAREQPSPNEQRSATEDKISSTSVANVEESRDPEELDEKYQSLIDESRTKVLAQKEPHGSETKGWVLVKDNNDILVSKKDCKDSSLIMTRVEGRVKARPQDVADLVSSMRHDPLVLGMKIVKQMDSCTDVAHLQYRSVYPFVSNRDFLLLRSRYQDPETGTCLCCATSLPPGHSNDVSEPVAKSCVRGEIINSGWVIEPFGEESFCTYVLCVNPKGWMPSWVVNMFQTDDIFMSFCQLKQLVEQSSAHHTPDCQ